MENMIGKRIKERRKKLQITQAQIKESTGISTGNLSEIENGKILPSSAALMRLSNILQCSTDYLLFGESSILEKKSISDLRSSAESRLLEYFRAISKQDQEELLILAQLKYDRTQKARLSPTESDDHNFISETA